MIHKYSKQTQRWCWCLTQIPPIQSISTEIKFTEMNHRVVIWRTHTLGSVCGYVMQHSFYIQKFSRFSDVNVLLICFVWIQIVCFITDLIHHLIQSMPQFSVSVWPSENLIFCFPHTIRRWLSLSVIRLLPFAPRYRQICKQFSRFLIFIYGLPGCVDWPNCWLENLATIIVMLFTERSCA